MAAPRWRPLHRLDFHGHAAPAATANSRSWPRCWPIAAGGVGQRDVMYVATSALLPSAPLRPAPGAPSLPPPCSTDLWQL